MAEKNCNNINEFEDPNKNLNNLKTNDDKNVYLLNRKWDYLDESKKENIEKKINDIYINMNKKQLENLEKSINRCNLNKLYEDFNPREMVKGIGTLSSLDFLIESKYIAPINIENMFSDKSKLEKYIYKYRNIQGERDSFYRGVIFSFMENIVLTNNIMQMKELLVLFYEKIHTKNQIIKQKRYLSNQIKF